MNKTNIYSNNKKSFGKLFFMFAFVCMFAIGSLTLAFSYSNNFKGQTQASNWSDNSVWNHSNFRGFQNGNGTASRPYEIPNEQYLGYFASVLNGSNASSYTTKYYKLTSNINLSGHNWQPVNEFKGHFDGNGNAIVNIKISGVNQPDVGFFKVLNGATIKNVVFDGNLTVTGPHSKIGGVAGKTEGNTKIEKVANNIFVTASGSTQVGGIVGYSVDTTIESSYNTAKINGSTYVGGLLGYGNANISNVYNTGSITSAKNQVGGIVGRLISGGKLTYSYNSGVITGVDWVGGIAGVMNKVSEFHTHENTANITGGGGAVGGIVGAVDATDISKVVNKGIVEGTNSLGGIVGSIGILSELSSDMTIKDALNTARVGQSTSVVTENAGGIVGYAYMSPESAKNTSPPANSKRLTMENVANKGAVFTKTKGGGLIGNLLAYSYNSHSLVIINSYNEGDVTTAGDYTGGLVGIIEGTRLNLAFGKTRTLPTMYYISGTYNSGKIDGRNNRGGLIGYVKGTDGVSEVSGAHYFQGPSSSLRDSFSSGLVVHRSSYKEYVGALIGRNVDDEGSNENVYYYANNASPSKAYGTGNSKGTNKSNGTAKSISSFTSSVSSFPTAFQRGYIYYYTGSTGSLSYGNFYVLKTSIYNDNIIQTSFSDSNVWAKDNSLINGGKLYLKDFYWSSL